MTIRHQNKEAEAKEELKRRAKQLEMQRREQQRRTAAGGPSGGGYLGGGVSGYSPVPQRFDAPSTPVRTSSPAPSSLRAPAFKSGGMKLGAKKSKQSELLDALGSEVLLSEDMSVPTTPAATTPEPFVQKDERGSLPTVTPERFVKPSCTVGCEVLTFSAGMVVYTLLYGRPWISNLFAKEVSTPWN